MNEKDRFLEDFDRLIAARNVVATALPDVELYGFTPDAGLPLSSP